MPWRNSTMGAPFPMRRFAVRSEEHTSELQSLAYLVCRLLLEKNIDPAAPTPTATDRAWHAAPADAPGARHRRPLRTRTRALPLLSVFTAVFVPCRLCKRPTTHPPPPPPPPSSSVR